MTTPIRTFLIEDNPLIRQNLVGMLEELAPVCVIGVAATESEAVCELSDRDNACELVIVDIVLKQGNGFGVLGHPAVKRPGRKFVVLSNHATTDVSRRAMQLGAQRVFDKSNDLDALVDFCRQLAAPSA